LDAINDNGYNVGAAADFSFEENQTEFKVVTRKRSQKPNGASFANVDY